MFLFIFIPLWLTFILFIIFYNDPNQQGTYTKIRHSLLYTFLITGAYCVLSTEVLSTFDLINFKWTLTTWLVPAIIITGYAIRKKQISSSKKLFPVLLKLFTRNWIFAVILFFLSVSLFVAIAYPPNNYDSMTYHMARVAHWIQNHNISYYQTHIVRQIVNQPFAEWAILHLQILSGGDRFANAVQLFFFIGCISNVTLITKVLGGNFRQQSLSALFTAVIPMAVIQSNTTQNDIVVAFFVLSFVYLTIRLAKKVSVVLLLLAGMALGLSWLTKGTAYIFTLPFACWYFLLLLKNFRLPLKTLLQKAILFAVVPVTALLFNSGYYYRNVFLSDSILGKTNENTANEAREIKPLILVGIKNIMNHFPVTGNLKVQLIQKSASWGIDANDPKYNFVPTGYMAEGFSFHEDYAQNFIHTILIILISLSFFCKRSTYNNRISYYTLFVFTILGISLLYCVLLKWQPWSNRLETALFMLFCTILAIELGSFKKWLQAICIVPMLAFGLIALFYNNKHPLLPVKESIFKKPYESFIYSDALLECQKYLDQKEHTKLGIFLGADMWDYPYYKLLSRFDGKSRILKHVFVDNESKIYLDSFVPDAIISIETGRDKYTLGGKDYFRSKVFQDGPALFEPR